MKKRRPVRICWVDAHDHPQDWIPLKDIKPGMDCESVGFIVKKTKQWITITHTLTQDNHSRGGFSIPMGCVKSIKPV